MNELALSFGRVAALYDRVRPNYSQESLDRAQAALGLDASAQVLDLAAGTGRLTHELARRLARVVAAESDEGIRAFVAEGDMLAGSAEDSTAALQATSFTAAARRSSQVGTTAPRFRRFGLTEGQRRSETAFMAQGRIAAFRVTHS